MDQGSSAEDLLAIHERLLGGDRVAPAELSRVLLPLLTDDLDRRFRSVDTHLIADSVVDALLDYCERPAQFDRRRGVPLGKFLANASRRNVENRLVSEKRRKNRERVASDKRRELDVALEPVARNIQREETTEMENRRVAMIAALTNDKDREILRLKLSGVRSLAEFAGVLGISDLSPSEQRAEVKRHKDRIWRFLRRKGFVN